MLQKYNNTPVPLGECTSLRARLSVFMVNLMLSQGTEVTAVNT